MLESATWKRIVDAEPSPICAFDHEFRLTAFNAAHSDQFFAIYGHRVQVGEIFPDLFLPEQGSIIRAFMARALSGEVFEVVEEFGNPDLSKPFWSISYAPLRDDAGRIVGAFHRAQDISAQLRSQTELAAAKQALQEAKLLNRHLGRTLALFDDQVSELLDVEAIAGLAAKVVGQTLNSDAVGMGLLQPDGCTVAIDHVWTAPNTRVSLDNHSVIDVSGHMSRLSGDEEDLVDDIAITPRTPAQAESWSALGVRSAVNLPVLATDEIRAVFLVLCAEPRVWDRSEVEFARTIVNRMRVHAARVRDEQSHRATAAQLVEEVSLRTSELERQARTLHDSQEFARLALSAVGGVGVWTYDVVDDRFFYDAAIAKLYGIDPNRGTEGMSSTDFLQHVHPADRASLVATMSSGLVSPGDLELEYRLRHSDGTVHWVLARGHTYFDDSGRPVRRTGVGIDMTTQRLLEEQLRQSQKMEAVGQLTGGIAHDFNNLLVGITGSLELLQRRMASGRLEGLDRYASTAITSAQRAAALTQRLLAFARRQPLDPKRVDANRLVADMEDLLRRTLGPGIDLEMVMKGGLWPTLCDPNQLESAILNLAINSRDAMPDGGRLTVETANVDLDDACARAQGSDVKAGQYVLIAVTDTGIGMPPDICEKAFDPFFTTKPLGQGTGLGLSMLYGFVKQSEGHVRIYSEVGKGTTFTLYLQRLREAVAAEPAEIPLDSQSALGAEDGETVLVVEDEAAVRMLVSETLEDLGYAAIEAAESKAALRVLESDARIDLLITDVGLPGLNGRQIADAARVVRPQLKVLFMTGYAHNAAIGNSDALETGMKIITKPFALDALAKTIREMIEET